MATSTGQTADKTSELVTLKSDLEQLIELSKDSLLELKKKKLLEELDLLTGTENETNISEITKIEQQKESNDIVGINIHLKP